MKIIYDPRCLEFFQPGHPESPQRLQAAYQYLQDRYEFISPTLANEEDLLKVHSQAHIERVRKLEFSDPDCPHYPRICEYAALSAGAAIQAARVQGFSLMRPPGHHASRERAAGFCYFNNIAVAVRAASQKTLIVDIDGHHGDGTQAIFLNDPQVIYISLHSSPNYPGTGLRSEANCHNYPLPFDCGDAKYLETLDTALSDVPLNGIVQIAVSAGFDTYVKDPLASLGLTSACYREIGRMITRLGKPTFAVLEGGYHIESLGKNIDEFIQELPE
jgi:acetoin utilization deacetylase AcuC-like enzyme